MLVMIICLLLLTISAWFVPSRLKKMLGLRTVWPWRLAAVVCVASFPAFLVSGVYTSATPLAAWAYSVCGLIFMFQVCLFLLLSVVHLLTPWLKKVSGRRMAALTVILSLLYTVIGFWQARTFVITHFDIPVKGLGRPVIIAHVSDLHLGTQRSEAYLIKMIEAVNEQKPDMVLFNGDLIDSNIALRPELFSLLKRLNAETYFTTGNHEHYLNTAKAMELISGAGIKILHSEMVETHGLQLIGLEYMNADRMTYDGHMVNDLTIEEELPRISRDDNRPSLLMHHSPVGLQYVIKGHIDVMLSGHTHGGQVFPGTLLAWLLFPLNKGLHQVDGTRFLVSQGAGTFGPWMRLGTFNEIQIITLRPL